MTPAWVEPAVNKLQINRRVIGNLGYIADFMYLICE